MEKAHVIIRKLSATSVQYRCSECKTPWLWYGECRPLRYCMWCGAEFDRTKDEEEQSEE